MLNVFRSLVPEPVRLILRGRHNSVKTRMWDNPRELLTLLLYRMRGKDYLQWYADRLDGFANGASAVSSGMADTHRYFLSGDEDLGLLTDLGLKPNHHLFELGCGYGRSAQHFVRYLDDGHYVGSEISRERLRQCDELLKHRRLGDKHPKLLVNGDNTFDWLDGRQFDFLWAGNVFTHVPPDDMEAIMANAHKVMHQNSCFVFTYTENPEQTMHRHHAKDWDRNYAYFKGLATRHGFQSENVSHLSKSQEGHGRSENERVVKFVPMERNSK
jgi:SAM-dependent methyltransferase